MSSEPLNARLTSVILALPIYLWLFAMVLVPMLLLLGYSFLRSESGAVVQEFTLVNYALLFERITYPLVLANTVLVALGSALLATLVAYPMAYFVCTNIRHHKIAVILLVIIPLWISLLLRAFAWKIILGENGALNSFLVSWGVLDRPTTLLLYNRFAVFLTLTYVSLPYVFITSYTALERIPRSLIEASRDAGASTLQTVRRIVWPLTRQPVAIGFALAFLISVGDYVTPAMVGGLNGTMIGTIIASQFGLAGNWPFGSALSIFLLIAVSAVLFAVAMLVRTRAVIEAGAPFSSINPPTWSSIGFARRAGRVISWVLFIVPYVVLYAPLLIIGVFSFNNSQTQAFPFAGVSLRWYSDLVANQNLLDALQRSVSVGLIVAFASMVVGTFFAILLSQRKFPAVTIVQSGLVVPAVLPGIVLGISLALTFRMFRLEPGIVTVILGQMTFVVPVIMLVVLARLRSLDPSLEQASADLGAQGWQTFTRIKLPLIRSAILGGGLLGFTLSFDEVIVTLFLSGPKPTLPVYIWNQLRFGFTPAINAAFTLIGIFSICSIVVATKLLDTSKKP